MSFYSRFKKFFLLASALGLLSCGGVGGGGGGQTTSQATVTRSLRIGQSDDANSRVAVSIAGNTRESITLLNTPGSNAEIVNVLYSSPDDDVARITVDSQGRPTSAETEDAKLTYSNYRDGKVDVTLTIHGVVFGTATVDVPSDAQSFLGRKLARANTDESVLQTLLRRAIISVRTFGCSVSNANFNGADVAKLFAVTAEACGSKLLDATNQVLKEGNVNSRLVTGLDNRNTCNFDDPNWINSFFNAQDCALGVGGQLVGVVDQIAPSIGDGVDNPPPPAPPPPPPPSSSSGTPDTGPTHSVFLGNWGGVLLEETVFTPCQTNQHYIFEVRAGDDPFCRKVTCPLLGQYDGVLFANTPFNGPVTGTIHDNGDNTADVTLFGFNAPGDSNGHATALMHLVATDTLGATPVPRLDGRYLTNFGCTGAIVGDPQ